MQAIISRSDKTKHDKVYRLRSKIESRLEYFDQAVKNYKDNRRQITKLYQLEEEYTQYINLLDIYILHTNTNNYQKVYDVVKNWPDRKTHLLEEFGIRQSEGYAKHKTLGYVLKQLEESAQQSSYARTCDRLKLELLDKKDKWYIVFSTLTVDAENYEDVFKKGSDCWRNYIRTIDRKVARDVYGSYRKAKGKEYFKYFAVVEHGGTTGRLHIHTLMFMESLIGCQDPNYGRQIPDYYEIKCLTEYWKYGFSSHRAVRFSANDSYGRAGWRWIVDKEGQPVGNSTVGKVAGYLTKYIMKSKQYKIKGEITSWKIKVTRTLGINKIQQRLQIITLKELEALVASRKYPLPIKISGEQITSKTIRSLAVKEYIHRMKNPQVLPKDTTLKMLCTTTTQKKGVRKLQSFGNLTVQLLKNKVTFNMEDFLIAKNAIESSFSRACVGTEVSGAGLESKI